jgi:uncharacterized protein YndB with AHSA1/START domain
MATDDYLERAYITIERDFEATPAQVYRAWTEPESMAKWMWAGLGSDAWAESDVRVGGAYRVYTKAPGGRHQGEGWSGMCGLYIEILPNEKLVYTLHWDADVDYNSADHLTLDEVVTVTFAPEGAGTRVTFTQSGFPDNEVNGPTHRAGTEAAFDLLAKILGEVIA